MTRKTLLSVCIFLTLIVASSCVFATNNLGDELKDSWDKTKNTVSNAGNTIGGVVSNVAHGVGNTVNSAMDNNRSTNGTAGITTNGNTDGYTATRTATTGSIGGLSDTMMTWIILAITAAIIVGLIWYYGTQNRNETRVKDSDNY